MNPLNLSARHNHGGLSYREGCLSENQAECPELQVTLATPSPLYYLSVLQVLLCGGVESQDQVRQADPGHHHLLHPQFLPLHCRPAHIPVLTG